LIRANSRIECDKQRLVDAAGKRVFKPQSSTQLQRKGAGLAEVPGALWRGRAESGSASLAAAGGRSTEWRVMTGIPPGWTTWICEWAFETEVE
jgi:hypothetical protein